jgi:alkylation response protein AidB-like acyl-CoA dehydrogenase
LSTLTFTEDQTELREFARSFADERIDLAAIREAEETKTFPVALWDALAEAGLHGLAVPKEYGGAGGGIVEQAIVEEQLGRQLGGLATLWSINTHSAQTIARHGTDEQRSTILPAIAAGKHRIALSFTEPGGGTDVLGALRTRARKVNGGFVLSGSKAFTTMAADSHQLLILARTSEHERKNQGLTMFLIDTDRKGVEYQRLSTMGHESFGTFNVFYDDVKISPSEVIGEVDNGWDTLKGTINHERVIIAACCTGTTRGVTDRAVAYAKEREAFGRPIGQFQAIQHFIADMEISYQASRLMTYHAASLAQDEKEYALEAAVAKTYASEACSKAADSAIQILGGAGYTKDHDVERMWRDTRIMRIGPISNEMVRNYVAERLGLPRSF